MITATLTNESILKGLLKLLEKDSVINVLGKAGTGKSSLMQFLLGNWLTRHERNKIVWVQACDMFSKKRYINFFGSTSGALRNFLLIPARALGSLEEQDRLLKRIADRDLLLPPNVRFLVIDNISRHLRTEMSKTRDVAKACSTQNAFFNETIFPLTMFLMKEGITLILVHEVSYNPKLNRETMFFHGLYDNVRASMIHLKQDLFTKDRTLELIVGDSKGIFQYDITSSEFRFQPCI